MFRCCLLLGKAMAKVNEISKRKPTTALQSQLRKLKQELDFSTFGHTRRAVQRQIEAMKQQIREIRSERKKAYNKRDRTNHFEKRRLAARDRYTAHCMDILESRAKRRHGASDAKFLRQMRYREKHQK